MNRLTEMDWLFVIMLVAGAVLFAAWGRGLYLQQQRRAAADRAYDVQLAQMEQNE